jgi:uncharacterized protein DUF5666
MSNIRLSKHLAAFGLALGLAVAATGCGGTRNVTVPPKSAARTQIKIGDAPADSVLSFELAITRVDLVQQGGATVNVLNTPSEIELSHLAGTVEPLVLADLSQGTYTGASITVSKAEVSYVPTGSSKPVEKSFALNATINLPFSPAVTIGSSPSILSFDVNLAQSLSFDPSGNVTAVNPMFAATTASVAPEADQEDETGKVEDIVGMVTAVTAASGTTPASFDLMPPSGGQVQTFQVSTNTEFGDGLTQFADLKTGMLVKVDGVTQADGLLLADAVEMMETSDGLEADGVVTATTGNPVTSLSLLVQDDAGNMAPNTVGTILNVDVSNAVFKTPMNDSDLVALLQGLPYTPKFDNTTVATGQRIEADGAGQMQGSFSANGVRLQEQALTGTVGPAVPGSNASFTLLLDADSAFVKLTTVSAVNVYQVPKTELMGISSITPGMKVRVRGLLFFDGANYQLVAARIAQP